MKLFDVDGPLFSALDTFSKLVLCNLCFVLFSIPVVTIGASLTALYTCTQRLVYGEEDALWYSDDGFRSFTLVYPSHDEALIPNAAVTPAPSKAPKATATPAPAAQNIRVDKDGTYSDKEHVALYIHLYGKLPSNYITKAQARALGWGSTTGNLWKVAPGRSIGGDHFGNYEGKLPQSTSYRECDIDYNGGNRNAKRIIYGDDGSVWYTEDHYTTFERLY